MAWHPVGDQCKVQVTGDKYNFGPPKVGRETGIVVEIPDILHFFGMHSSQLDTSFMSERNLNTLLNYYKKFVDKPVAWESLQDRGRHFKEDDVEYVYLKFTDIIAVGDSKADLETAEMSDDDRASAGSFNL
jgi:hypothetical protein